MASKKLHVSDIFVLGTRIGGLWYSAPKKGTCNETQSVGTGDCTWKRHSSADVVYGAQLMALGWNNSVFISGTVLVLCCVLNVS